MRSIKAFAAVLCALAGITATNAFAVLEFKQTGMGYLVISGAARRVIKTNAGTVECAEMKIVKVAASEAELNIEWQLMVVEWSKCVAFGFVTTKPIEAMLDVDRHFHGRTAEL